MIANIFFDFIEKFSKEDIYKTQYFGFFLNWKFVYDQENELLPEILNLIKIKSNNFELPSSTKKGL